jgi:hypothetical protein
VVEVNTIFSVVGQWPDFRKFVPGEAERLELCRRIRAEDWLKHQVIVRQGEDNDGWYLIFSGQCSFFQLHTISEDAGPLPMRTLQSLRGALGQDKCFSLCGVKGPTEEFGGEALTSNSPRPWSVVCDRQCVLLHIDPFFYHATIQWLAHSQLERRVGLLGNVSEFQVLAVSHEGLSRIAESMEEIRLPAGTVINDSTYRRGADEGAGFIVIHTGVVVQRRKIFSTEVAPMGTARTPAVTIREFGAMTMFPLPGVRGGIIFPFQMVAIQPVVGYLLRLDEMASILVKSQCENLVQMMSQQPDDEEIKTIWLERQRAMQWQSFRKSVTKGVRQIAKAEKGQANGDFAIRKPAPPKSIKDYRPFTAILQRVEMRMG